MKSFWDYVEVSQTELRPFETAFKKCKYLAPEYPRMLHHTMDQYMPSSDPNQKEDNYYNRSFTIVQSSGTGKSRLVDESAKSRFTFPFNIHEKMDRFSGTYPPFDHDVRDYFISPLGLEIAKIEYYVFLEALFGEAVGQIREYQKGTPEEVARRWYEWMDYGSTVMKVGTNRTRFYGQVLRKASEFGEMINKKLCLEKPESELDAITQICHSRLLEAASAFLACLQGLHTEVAQGFLAVIYFDEAHTLCKLHGGYIHYSLLMQVLNTLVELPIFFIFVSTNNVINTFKVPKTHSSYSSRNQLIPPFFKLPFDCFYTDFMANAKMTGAAELALTLNGACALRQLVKFGRPMWESYYQTLGEYDQHRIMKLANLKMGSTGKSYSPDARLASVACRVLPQLGCTSQTELIRSYMCVVFNISEGRDYIWSGYPSEPLLAEAAGQFLYNSAADSASVRRVTTWLQEFVNLFPDTLYNAGPSVCEDPGDLLVIKTLFTVAHDLVIKKYPSATRTGLRFHQPIRLLDLLQNLCSNECWETVKSATPYETFSGAPTLEDAFKDAWVNFSHFVQLGDFASFNLKCFSELLKRGAAVCAFNGHPDWDGAIPVYFGNPAKTPISYGNTSALLMRDGSTRVGTKVSSKLKALNGKDVNNLPVVSIAFELRVATHTSGAHVTVGTTAVDLDMNIATGSSLASTAGSVPMPVSVQRRHYMIMLYGYTTHTYKCVPEYAEKYGNLLRSHELSVDFVRKYSESNKEAFYGLKRYMYS